MSQRLKTSLKYAIYTYIGLCNVGAIFILSGIADESQSFASLAIGTLWPAFAVWLGSYLYIVKK